MRYEHSQRGPTKSLFFSILPPFLLLFFETLLKKSSGLIEVNSSMMNTITKPNHWIQRLYTIEKKIFGQDFLAKKFK
jgi:hypothetical protein